MFEEKTVVLLGAGASLADGYPLGADLKKEILTASNNTINLLKLKGDLPSLGREEASSTPLQNALVGELAGLDDPIARQFTELRSQQEFFSDLEEDIGSTTIDAFLKTFPDHRNIGRIFISLCLFEHRIGFDAKTRLFQKCKSQNTVRSKNWYPLLIEKIREGCHRSGDLSTNQLTIATFNYDMSLDNHLLQYLPLGVFKNTAVPKVAPIFHLYGQLAEPVYDDKLITRTHLCQHIFQQSKDIEIMGSSSFEDNSIAPLVRHHISEASTLIILGYGFHPPNNELLDLDNLVVGKRLFATNYGGNGRIQSLLRERWTKHTKRDSISIDDIEPSISNWDI